MLNNIDTNLIDELCNQQNALNMPQTIHRVGTVLELRLNGDLAAYASAGRGIYLPDGTNIIDALNEAIDEWDQFNEFLDSTNEDYGQE